MPMGHGDERVISHLADKLRRRRPCSFLGHSGLHVRRPVSPVPHFVQTLETPTGLPPSITALWTAFGLLWSLLYLPSNWQPALRHQGSIRRLSPWQNPGRTPFRRPLVCDSRGLMNKEPAMMTNSISGVKIPDSKMAPQVTQFIRDSESDLLFRHSTRVYFWAALIGKRDGLMFDPELLYAGAMFHDL